MKLFLTIINVLTLESSCCICAKRANILRRLTVTRLVVQDLLPYIRNFRLIFFFHSINNHRPKKRKRGDYSKPKQENIQHTGTVTMMIITLGTERNWMMKREGKKKEILHAHHKGRETKNQGEGEGEKRAICKDDSTIFF